MFSVDWTCQTPNTNNTYPHAEFDISVQRNIWQAASQGYPKQLSALPTQLVLSQDSYWARNNGGRLHVNVIIWINTKADDTGERIDITVSEWANTGKISFQKIGEITHAGSVYDVYKRSGDVGEKASYNIIRRDNRTAGLVDAKVFINWLLSWENANTKTFTSAWCLNKLGWEVTGQSAKKDSLGVIIPNSSAKYVFNCYSIPVLTGSQVALCPNAVGSNVLVNPGFEDNVLTGWGVYGTASANVEWQGYTGTRSGRTYGRGSSTAGLKQSILNKVSKGSRVHFEGWIKLHTGSATATTNIQIRRVDGAGTQMFNVASGTTNGWSWNKIQGDWTASWTGTLTALDIVVNGPDASIPILSDDMVVSVN